MNFLISHKLTLDYPSRLIFESSSYLVAIYLLLAHKKGQYKIEILTWTSRRASICKGYHLVRIGRNLVYKYSKEMFSLNIQNLG